MKKATKVFYTISLVLVALVVLTVGGYFLFRKPTDNKPKYTEMERSLIDSILSGGDTTETKDSQIQLPSTVSASANDVCLVGDDYLVVRVGGKHVIISRGENSRRFCYDADNDGVVGEDEQGFDTVYQIEGDYAVVSYGTVTGSNRPFIINLKTGKIVYTDGDGTDSKSRFITIGDASSSGIKSISGIKIDGHRAILSRDESMVKVAGTDEAVGYDSFYSLKVVDLKTGLVDFFHTDSKADADAEQNNFVISFASSDKFLLVRSLDWTRAYDLSGDTFKLVREEQNRYYLADDWQTAGYAYAFSLEDIVYRFGFTAEHRFTVLSNNRLFIEKLTAPTLTSEANWYVGFNKFNESAPNDQNETKTNNIFVLQNCFVYDIANDEVKDYKKDGKVFGVELSDLAGFARVVEYDFINHVKNNDVSNNKIVTIKNPIVNYINLSKFESVISIDEEKYGKIIGFFNDNLICEKAVLDLKGNVVLNCLVKGSSLGRYGASGNVYNGVFVIQNTISDMFGLADVDGNILLDCNYNKISTITNGYCFLFTSNSISVYNISAKAVVDIIDTSTTLFNNISEFKTFAQYGVDYYLSADEGGTTWTLKKLNGEIIKAGLARSDFKFISNINNTTGEMGAISIVYNDNGIKAKISKNASEQVSKTVAQVSLGKSASSFKNIKLVYADGGSYSYPVVVNNAESEVIDIEGAKIYTNLDRINKSWQRGFCYYQNNPKNNGNSWINLDIASIIKANSGTERFNFGGMSTGRAVLKDDKNNDLVFLWYEGSAQKQGDVDIEFGKTTAGYEVTVTINIEIVQSGYYFGTGIATSLEVWDYVMGNAPTTSSEKNSRVFQNYAQNTTKLSATITLGNIEGGSGNGYDSWATGAGERTSTNYGVELVGLAVTATPICYGVYDVLFDTNGTINTPVQKYDANGEGYNNRNGSYISRNYVLGSQPASYPFSIDYKNKSYYVLANNGYFIDLQSGEKNNKTISYTVNELSKTVIGGLKATGSDGNNIKSLVYGDRKEGWTTSVVVYESYSELKLYDLDENGEAYNVLQNAILTGNRGTNGTAIICSTDGEVLGIEELLKIFTNAESALIGAIKSAAGIYGWGTSHFDATTFKDGTYSKTGVYGQERFVIFSGGGTANGEYADLSAGGIYGLYNNAKCSGGFPFTLKKAGYYVDSLDIINYKDTNIDNLTDEERAQAEGFGRGGLNFQSFVAGDTWGSGEASSKENTFNSIFKASKSGLSAGLRVVNAVSGEWGDAFIRDEDNNRKLYKMKGVSNAYAYSPIFQIFSNWRDTGRLLNGSNAETSVDGKVSDFDKDYQYYYNYQTTTNMMVGWTPREYSAIYIAEDDKLDDINLVGDVEDWYYNDGTAGGNHFALSLIDLGALGEAAIYTNINGTGTKTGLNNSLYARFSDASESVHFSAISTTDKYKILFGQKLKYVPVAAKVGFNFIGWQPLIVNKEGKFERVTTTDATGKTVPLIFKSGEEIKLGVTNSDFENAENELHFVAVFESKDLTFTLEVDTSSKDGTVLNAGNFKNYSTDVFNRVYGIKSTFTQFADYKINLEDFRDKTTKKINILKMPQIFKKTYLINNWMLQLLNKAVAGGEAYVDVNYIPFGENETTGVKNVANSDIYAAQNFNIVKFLKQINADLKEKAYADGSGRTYFDDSIVPNASGDGFMMDTGYTLSNFTLGAQLIDFFVRTDFDASTGCVTGEVTEVNGKTTTIITTLDDQKQANITPSTKFKFTGGLALDNAGQSADESGYRFKTIAIKLYTGEGDEFVTLNYNVLWKNDTYFAVKFESAKLNGTQTDADISAIAGTWDLTAAQIMLNENLPSSGKMVRFNDGKTLEIEIPAVYYGLVNAKNEGIVANIAANGTLDSISILSDVVTFGVIEKAYDLIVATPDENKINAGTSGADVANAVLDATEKRQGGAGSLYYPEFFNQNNGQAKWQENGAALTTTDKTSQNGQLNYGYGIAALGKAGSSALSLTAHSIQAGDTIYSHVLGRVMFAKLDAEYNETNDSFKYTVAKGEGYTNYDTKNDETPLELRYLIDVAFQTDCITIKIYYGWTIIVGADNNQVGKTITLNDGHKTETCEYTGITFEGDNFGNYPILNYSFGLKAGETLSYSSAECHPKTNPSMPDHPRVSKEWLTGGYNKDVLFAAVFDEFKHSSFEVYTMVDNVEVTDGDNQDNPLYGTTGEAGITLFENDKQTIVQPLTHNASWLMDANGNAIKFNATQVLKVRFEAPKGTYLKSVRFGSSMLDSYYNAVRAGGLSLSEALEKMDSAESSKNKFQPSLVCKIVYVDGKIQYQYSLTGLASHCSVVGYRNNATSPEVTIKSGEVHKSNQPFDAVVFMLSGNYYQTQICAEFDSIEMVKVSGAIVDFNLSEDGKSNNMADLDYKLSLIDASDNLVTDAKFISPLEDFTAAKAPLKAGIYFTKVEKKDGEKSSPVVYLIVGKKLKAVNVSVRQDDGKNWLNYTEITGASALDRFSTKPMNDKISLDGASFPVSQVTFDVDSGSGNSAIDNARLLNVEFTPKLTEVEFNFDLGYKAGEGEGISYNSYSNQDYYAQKTGEMTNLQALMKERMQLTLLYTGFGRAVKYGVEEENERYLNPILGEVAQNKYTFENVDEFSKKFMIFNATDIEMEFSKMHYGYGGTKIKFYVVLKYKDNADGVTFDTNDTVQSDSEVYFNSGKLVIPGELVKSGTNDALVSVSVMALALQYTVIYNPNNPLPDGNIMLSLGDRPSLFKDAISLSTWFDFAATHKFETEIDGKTTGVDVNNLTLNGFDFGGWWNMKWLTNEEKFDGAGDEACAINAFTTNALQPVYGEGKQQLFTYNEMLFRSGDTNQAYTLFAKWTPKLFDISLIACDSNSTGTHYDQNGNSGVSNALGSTLARILLESGGNREFDASYLKSINENTNGKFKFGQTIKLPNLVRVGYVFKGWGKEVLDTVNGGVKLVVYEVGTDGFNNYKVDFAYNKTGGTGLNDATTYNLYAIWEAKTVDVIYNYATKDNNNGNLLDGTNQSLDLTGITGNYQYELGATSLTLKIKFDSAYPTFPRPRLRVEGYDLLAWLANGDNTSGQNVVERHLTQDQNNLDENTTLKVKVEPEVELQWVKVYLVSKPDQDSDASKREQDNNQLELNNRPTGGIKYLLKDYNDGNGGLSLNYRDVTGGDFNAKQYTYHLNIQYRSAVGTQVFNNGQALPTAVGYLLEGFYYFKDGGFNKYIYGVVEGNGVTASTDTSSQAGQLTRTWDLMWDKENAEPVRLYARWLIKQFKITIKTTENGGHSLINGVALPYGSYSGTNATFGTNTSLSLILKAYDAEGGFQFSGAYTISKGLERTVKFYEKIEFEIQMAQGHYLSVFTLSREGASGGGGYTWDHANQTISGSKSITLGRGSLDAMSLEVDDYDSDNAVNNVLATMTRVTDSYTISVDFARQWYVFTVVKMIDENGTLKENPNHINLERPYMGVVTDGDLDKGLAFHNVAGYFKDRECTIPFNESSYTVVKDVSIYIKYTPSNDVSHEAKFYGWTKSGYTKLETGKDYVGAYIDNGVTYINGQNGRQWSTAINGLTIVKLPTPTSVYWPDQLAADVDEYGNVQYVNTGFVLAYWVKIIGGASINKSAPITPYVLKNSGLEEGTHYSIVVPSETQIDATGCTIYAVYESIDKTFDIEAQVIEQAQAKSDLTTFNITKNDITQKARSFRIAIENNNTIDAANVTLFIATLDKNGLLNWDDAIEINLVDYSRFVNIVRIKDDTFQISNKEVTFTRDTTYYFKFVVTTGLKVKVESSNIAEVYYANNELKVAVKTSGKLENVKNAPTNIRGGKLEFKDLFEGNFIDLIPNATNTGTTVDFNGLTLSVTGYELIADESEKNFGSYVEIVYKEDAGTYLFEQSDYYGNTRQSDEFYFTFGKTYKDANDVTCVDESNTVGIGVKLTVDRYGYINISINVYWSGYTNLTLSKSFT